MHANVKGTLDAKNLSQNVVIYEIMFIYCVCVRARVLCMCACPCVHMPLFSPAGWAGSTVTLVPVC